MLEKHSPCKFVVVEYCIGELSYRKHLTNDWVEIACLSTSDAQLRPDLYSLVAGQRCKLGCC